MNILKRIFNYIILFFYGVVNFIKMIIKSLIPTRNYIDLVFGIIYQPIIFLIAFLILSHLISNIEKILYNTQKSVLSYVIILIILLVIIVLSLNALIELIYYLLHKKERYNVIFSIQKGLYNYSLTIISLIAFWVAYDNTTEAVANLNLLILGIFFFLCVIITDLYNFLIHSQNKIEVLCDCIIQKKKELF